MSATPQLLTRAERAYAWLRHVAAHTYLRLGLFFALALVAMWPTLGSANMMNDFRDGQYFTLYEEAARLAVARFHQLPLWDPYYCGGISALGTPSARFASPTFLLTLIFGTFRGDALIAMTMTIVGLEGTFRYVRSRGAGSLAAMAVAPMFALSGIFGRAEALDWMNFFSFQLVPWALLGVRLAFTGSRRGVVIAALAVGWMIGFGGTYTAPLTALVAGFELVVLVALRARTPHRIALALLMGVLVLLLSVAVSLVRLWPVAETLSSSPRLLGGTPGTAPKAIWEFMFGARPPEFKKDDFLVGLPALPLIVVGIFRKRSIPLTLSGVVWLGLALGYKAPFPFFALLRQVPPYTMLRAPERFLVFVALVAAALAALGVRRIEARTRRNPRFVVAAFACIVVLVCNTALLTRVARQHSNTRTMVPPPTPTGYDFRQARGNRWLASHYPFIGRGSLFCFDDYDVAQSSKLRGDLPHEEYLADPDAGRVVRRKWSPGRIDVHVELTRPTRLLVNQNWHPGWHASVGTLVSSDGLLAADLPEGTYDVTLRFLPRSGLGGLATTLLGLLVAGILWRRSRDDDWVAPGREWLITAGLCAAPFLATAASFLVLREPRFPPPALLTPSGEPMIVDAPPEGSTPVGANWEGGIVLESAQVLIDPTNPGPGGATPATLELDWRLDQKPPPGLGVFIRFEKPGASFGADHVLLSSSALFEDVPQHVTIRDVSETIMLPKGKDEATWKVYVGVWRARRDQTRLSVLDAGKGTLSSGNRVLVETFVSP